jgi:hypothetical protein
MGSGLEACQIYELTSTPSIESNIEKEEDRASLEINLKIQRDWSEMTMLCQGLQGMGIENVA